MVTGTGLPSLPIRLYEVDMTGKQLANGVIDEQGTFSIQLLTPLKAGQRVGLVLGDLKGTSFRREQVKQYALIDLPIIGLLFDDAPVE